MSDTNRALATIFQAIADLLATRLENPHRIRAYRRAAESVLSLPEDIGAVAQRGELRRISGVGKELAAKIEEFLTSGRIQTYDEMKTPLPREVADWATLPGLSEPVLQYLYFRLGIRTLSDLETLAQSHLLRTLPGFTASEDALLEAIRSRRPV